jgi:hypothetical protein
MGDGLVGQLGAVGILAYLVINRLLEALVAKRDPTARLRPQDYKEDISKVVGQCNDMHRWLYELHRWHAPDPAGRQTWKDMSPLIGKLEQMIEILKAIATKQQKD